MKRISAIGYVSLILWGLLQQGCTWLSPDKQKTESVAVENSSRKIVALKSLSLSMEVDQYVSLKESGGVYTFEDENRKMTRNPRTFKIGPGASPRGDYELSTENESVLIRYQLEDSHQGSSGIEQSLSGMLTVKATREVYKIEGWDISSQPDAAWCLKYFLTVTKAPTQGVQSEE